MLSENSDRSEGKSDRPGFLNIVEYSLAIFLK